MGPDCPVATPVTMSRIRCFVHGCGQTHAHRFVVGVVYLLGMTTDYTPWTPDMPIVTVTITEPDTLSVKVFNIDYRVPDSLLPLHRESFGAVMDHLHDRLCQPFSVEIIESDGSRQHGTIDLGDHIIDATTPPVQPRHMASPPIKPSLEEADQPPQPRHELPAVQPNSSKVEPGVLVQVTGYQPGEEAAIAFIMAGTQVDATGQVSFQIPRRLVESLPSGEIIIWGRTSNVVTAVDPLHQR